MCRQVLVSIRGIQHNQQPIVSWDPPPSAVGAAMLLALLFLQRLDLSTPIKNPRRDFSNGFLAAEMMARFYVSAPSQLTPTLGS